jgi:peroxiredoxin
MQKTKIILILLILSAALTAPVFSQDYAPDFTLEDAWGNLVSLEDFAGSWIHLDFSADWCYWCHFQGAYFSEVMEYMNDIGADFVSIAILSEDEYGDPPGSAVLEKWVYDYNIENVLADPYGEVTGQYPVEGFPTNVIVSPQGEIVHSWSGAYQTADDFLSALENEIPEMFAGSGY